MGRCYVLCVFPDSTPHPIAISSDRRLDISRLLTAFIFPGYSLYAVYPSWIERLPDDGDFRLPEAFGRDPVSYRMQFLPSSYPRTFLRFATMSDRPIQFHSWCVALVNGYEKVTLKDILGAFDKNFWVETESMAFVSRGAAINVDLPIIDQVDALKVTALQLRIALQDRETARARYRIEVVKEILFTERSYVKDMGLTAEHFTSDFFRKFNLPGDLYARTFKGTAEIGPIHANFLAALEGVGCAPESCPGQVFLDYVGYFRVAAPHVSNFSSTNTELADLLRTDRPFARAVWHVCQDVFDGRSVESILVSPVQRIPRYPLLLRDLLKSTPDKHWDYVPIHDALGELKKVNKDIDRRTREQNAINFMSKLQQKFGSGYAVVSMGRTFVTSIDPFRPRNGTVGALYLFTDLILYHRQQPTEEFIEFQMLRTRVANGKGVFSVTGRVKLTAPEAEETREFGDKFQVLRREYVQRICTFDGALSWSAVKAPGPTRRRSAAMVSIGRDLYVFGGRREDKIATNELWWYHGGEWRLLETINSPCARYDCSLCVYEERLIVFGGHSGHDVFGDLWEFEIPSLTWTNIVIPDAPSPRFAHAAAFTTTQLWLFGGTNQSTYFNDFYCCDLYEGVWYQIKTQTTPEPRAWHSAFWITEGENLMFAIFGGASRSSAQSAIWIFDYDLCDWYAPVVNGEPLGARFAHVSAVIDSKLYIIGGRNMTNTPLEAIKVDISSAPYEATLIPQADEPDHFQYGACSILEGYGIALFGSGRNETALWEIKLAPTLDPPPPLPQKPGTKVDRGLLSAPLFNSVSEMVTVAIGDAESTLCIDRWFDPKSLEDMARNDGGVWRWRGKMVHVNTDEEETLPDLLLPESMFIKIPPPAIDAKKPRLRALTRSEKMSRKDKKSGTDLDASDGAEVGATKESTDWQQSIDSFRPPSANSDTRLQRQQPGDIRASLQKRLAERARRRVEPAEGRHSFYHSDIGDSESGLDESSGNLVKSDHEVLEELATRKTDRSQSIPRTRSAPTPKELEPPLPPDSPTPPEEKAAEDVAAEEKPVKETDTEEEQEEEETSDEDSSIPSSSDSSVPSGSENDQEETPQEPPAESKSLEKFPSAAESDGPTPAEQPEESVVEPAKAASSESGQVKKRPTDLDEGRTESRAEDDQSAPELAKPSMPPAAPEAEEEKTKKTTLPKASSEAELPERKKVTLGETRMFFTMTCGDHRARKSAAAVPAALKFSAALTASGSIIPMPDDSAAEPPEPAGRAPRKGLFTVFSTKKKDK